jgi:colicin import membrane protein
MVEPPGLRGNPEAVFTVQQLPGGEVLDVRLVRPSGFPQFDRAVENAIRAASPLPLPDDMTLFKREFPVTYRLRDD